MDNFMEKLAQRFNASEMIKANSQAEAREIEKLREQIAEYDRYIQEMRQLHLKNVETTETFRNLIEQAAKTAEKTADEGALEAVQKQMEDFMHKESVKVYRNVQAAVKDEMASQTADIMVAVEDTKTGKGATLLFAILAFLLAAGNLAVTLLHMYGMI